MVTLNPFQAIWNYFGGEQPKIPPASSQPSVPGAFTPPASPDFTNPGRPSYSGSRPNFGQPDTMVPRENPLALTPGLNAPITNGPLVPMPGDLALGVNISPVTGDIRRDPNTGQVVVPSMVGMPDPVINPEKIAMPPLPPARPKDLASTKGAVPSSPRVAVRQTPPLARPAPALAAAAPAADVGYEYYQTENERGELMWATRPKGHAGAMGGDRGSPYTAQGFQNAGTGMNLEQANAYNRERPAGTLVGNRAGQGLRSLAQGLQAPPNATAGMNTPPGVPLPPARPVGLGGSGGYMIPEGNGLTVPAGYNADGSGLSANEILNANPNANVMGVTPQGQPIMQGDPQAGLPDWMKGSSFANFLQFLGGKGGGF